MLSILAITLTALSSSAMVQGAVQAPDPRCEKPELHCRLQNKENGHFCNNPNRKYDSPLIPDCCEGDNADFCEACHSNGCDQCCDYTFKPDFCTPCRECKEFDPYALFCTDFYGSQQCLPGCQLTKVPRCDTIFADQPKCPDSPKGDFLHVCKCPEDFCDPPCLASLNVAFLVDGSGSINSNQFKQEVAAVNAAIDLLSDESKAMVIQFSGPGKHVLEQDLELAVNIGALAFDQLGQNTFWVQAMEEAIETLDNNKADNNASLLVLITDGQNQDPNPCGPCNNGICDGIPLLVMAVEGAVIQPCYVGDVNNVFKVDDFASLDQELDRVLGSLCQDSDKKLQLSILDKL